MDQKYNPILKEDLHPGSGVLSLIAIYAARDNKFWAINDYLYDYSVNKAIYLREIAEESGLHLDHLKTGIHAPEILKKLQKDILSGMKANIIGTPSYIIDKKVYAGIIPPDILNSLK
jgi:protein-disulfide isomerase